MKLVHVTISVADMAQSLHFYETILGLPIVRRFAAGPGREIVFLSAGETSIELIASADKTEISVGADISLGFEVPSLADMTALLAANNIAATDVISPQPGVSFIFANDPNGVRVQFVETHA